MPSFVSIPSRALFTMMRTPAGARAVGAGRRAATAHGVLHTLLALPALAQTRPVRSPRDPARMLCACSTMRHDYCVANRAWLPRVCVCSSGEEAARAVGVQPLHQVSVPVTTFFILLCVAASHDRRWLFRSRRCMPPRWPHPAGGRAGVQRQELLQTQRERPACFCALSLSLSPVYTRRERERERERERGVGTR